jgi:dTDP-4-amino-4,6-dideoxygalactose transaminase
LWHGLRALGVKPGAVVLVPAYHCGSEVEALARAGVRCRFYEATDSLEPDERELNDLLDERVVGLYLIHYLGFPQDAPRWRRWCDTHRLLLIEDAAQAWLGKIGEQALGSFGDLSIFSFYKSFGVPDGAALLVGTARQPPQGGDGFSLATLAIRHAEWLLGRSELLANLGARLRPELDLIRGEFDASESFALGNPNSLPSRTSLFLLPRVFDMAAARRRRHHYARLLEELGHAVPAPFARLPIGACPWAFPVETVHKRNLLEQLVRQRVRALNMWSVPHPSLPAARFPGASSWRAGLVGLPVHQELRECDVTRLAAVVAGSLRALQH